MKIRMFLVLAFLCMGFATRASAQMYTADSDCSWDFSPDDGTIYTTATVEGQLNSNAIPGARHTYSNQTILNGVAMLHSGGPSRNYVSVTNYQQATIVPGQLVSYSCGETVDCNMMGQVYNEQDNYSLPVVTLAISYSGPGNPIDPSWGHYSSSFDTPNLGAFQVDSFSNDACGVGFEVMGTVNPTTYSGNIPLMRMINYQAIYLNQTYIGGLPPGYDDSSSDTWMSQNPQAVSPPGTVWDLDAPGWINTLSVSPNVNRYRTNFVEQAFLPDMVSPVSAPQPFYVRVSCIDTGEPNGYVLATDVAGDNQAGPGNTITSWNLQ